MFELKDLFYIFYSSIVSKRTTVLSFTTHVNITLCDILASQGYHNGTNHILSPQESKAAVSI